jgi:hypothetical protein
MLEKAFISYFLTLSFHAILFKYDVFTKLEVRFAHMKNRLGRILLESVQCDFCRSHHVAIIPSLITCSFMGFNWFDFFVPLMVSGINIAVKKWK